jgi:flagellar biogenesis protein FliO
VTFSTVVGVALTLALVLALVAVTMRLLRRVTSAATTSRGTVPLAVLQRVALGPRQGIAIVQIGDQLIAVSVGEGGVHMIAELEALPVAATGPVSDAPRPGFDFRTALRAGLRSAGLPMGVLLLATLLAPVPARAQRPDSVARPTVVPAVTPPAATLVRPTAGQAAKPTAAQVAKPTVPTAAKPSAVGAAAPAASLDAITRALPRSTSSWGRTDRRTACG